MPLKVIPLMLAIAPLANTTVRVSLAAVPTYIQGVSVNGASVNAAHYNVGATANRVSEGVAAVAAVERIGIGVAGHCVSTRAAHKVFNVLQYVG